MDYKYDVFISYSRKDYVDGNNNIIPDNIISVIKQKLKESNISYWMDEEGNLTGKKFAHIIAGKIRESMTFLFVCSHNSVASRWVDRELSVADALEKHIIPLICDDSFMDDKVIMFTTSLDRIEYAKNPDKELGKLVSAIVKDKQEIENKKKEEEIIRIQKLKEEEEIRKKQEEEKRKQKIIEDIKELVSEYMVHKVQQEALVQQIYNKNIMIGKELKSCPVCGETTSLNEHYCKRCGWQFPKLFSVDGSDSNLYDKHQLSIAVDNWNRLEELDKTIEMYENRKTSLETEVNNLKESQKIMQEKCQTFEMNSNKYETEIKSLQEEKDSISHQLSDHKKEIENKGKRILESLKEIEKLKNSLKSLKDDNQRKDIEICVLNDRLEQYNKSKALYGKEESIKSLSDTSYIISKKRPINSSVQSKRKELDSGNQVFSARDNIFTFVRSYCNNKHIKESSTVVNAKIKYKKLSEALKETYHIEISEFSLQGFPTIGELVDTIWQEII